MQRIYVNGRFFPLQEARISVFDRGYLYGEGAFETLRSYNGHVAFCNLHYHRLRQNCAQLKIDLPLDEFSFERTLHRCLQVNKLRDAYIRVTVSPVGASYGIDRPLKMPTDLVIFCREFKGRPRSTYEKGASIILIKSVTGEAPELATIKSTSYLARMLGRMEVQAARADEGLMRSPRGLILEGTATNLFLAMNGRLYTPPLADGVLPGITRFIVMGLADSLDIPWREAHISVANLKRADELFLTGSTTEILPIRTIRGVATKRAPGPVTRRLMAAYQKLLPVGAPSK